jgi:hypothetical protein
MPDWQEGWRSTFLAPAFFFRGSALLLRAHHFETVPEVRGIGLEGAPRVAGGLHPLLFHLDASFDVQDEPGWPLRAIQGRRRPPAMLVPMAGGHSQGERSAAPQYLGAEHDPDDRHRDHPPPSRHPGDSHGGSGIVESPRSLRSIAPGDCGLPQSRGAGLKVGPLGRTRDRRHRDLGDHVVFPQYRK